MCTQDLAIHIIILPISMLVTPLHVPLRPSPSAKVLTLTQSNNVADVLRLSGSVENWQHTFLSACLLVLLCVSSVYANVVAKLWWEHSQSVTLPSHACLVQSINFNTLVHIIPAFELGVIPPFYSILIAAVCSCTVLEWTLGYAWAGIIRATAHCYMIERKGPIGKVLNVAILTVFCCFIFSKLYFWSLFLCKPICRCGPMLRTFLF